MIGDPWRGADLESEDTFQASTKFTPFEVQHLAEAGAVLARRHRQDRLARPELPERFEDAEVARRAVEAAWRRPWTSGFAAFEGDRLRGYLMGELEVADMARERSASIRRAGHAVDLDTDPRLFQDLYALAAPEWLTAGCFSHDVTVPAADDAELHAWFSLGFGAEQVWALRALTDADLTEAADVGDMTIRRAGTADRAAFVDLSPLISRQYVRAPIWTPLGPEIFADRRTNYAEVLADPSVTIWLACRGDQILGFQLYFPIETRDDALHLPDSCIDLNVGATVEFARGQGIGTLLTQRGLAEARAAGYDWCVADWRTTNLLAARFWPHRGFREVVYRLRRRIDERIAWAHRG
jgi:GNAT superfamily N-acetyltransferase